MNNCLDIKAGDNLYIAFYNRERKEFFVEEFEVSKVEQAYGMMYFVGGGVLDLINLQGPAVDEFNNWYTNCGTDKEKTEQELIDFIEEKFKKEIEELREKFGVVSE